MNTTKPILMAALLASAMAIGATAALADGMIAVVGGKADDPFFAKVKKGIDEATAVVEEHGGTVNYLMLQTYDNIGGDAANLVRTAISQQAAAIAVPVDMKRQKNLAPSALSAMKSILPAWRAESISAPMTPRT
jgi:simple sugar transport system substrate-binding protein